jgi:hypothetical protein
LLFGLDWANSALACPKRLANRVCRFYRFDELQLLKLDKQIVNGSRRELGEEALDYVPIARILNEPEDASILQWQRHGVTHPPKRMSLPGNSKALRICVHAHSNVA